MPAFFIMNTMSAVYLISASDSSTGFSAPVCARPHFLLSRGRLGTKQLVRTVGKTREKEFALKQKRITVCNFFHGLFARDLLLWKGQKIACPRDLN